MTDKKTFSRPEDRSSQKPRGRHGDRSGKDGPTRERRPQPASARLCAARAVQQILRDGAQLETALARQEDYGRLDPRDRAFARLITATVFRRMGQIDAALKPFVRKEPASFPHAVLRTGTAQLLFLKTPIHAAVGESVALLSGSPKTTAYAGMVNAVLRKVAEKGPALSIAEPPSKNIPGWIRASWEKAYGRSAVRRLALQLTEDPPLDVHVRGDAAGWAEKLGGEAISDWMVRLSSAGSVPALPGYDDGDWWIQDFAASLPVKCFGDVSGLSVLDMCAAPGGKTLQLAAAGAKVTAVDKSPERMERVHENLKRAKLEATCIIADAASWARETDAQFDIVLLDAPCSATGTFRRHPDVLQNRSPKDVGGLVRLQKRLIHGAVSLVKPGGRLVYCSCSLQPEEGEGQAAYIDETFEALSSVPLVKAGLPLTTPLWTEDGKMRAVPHLLGESGGIDGFYAAMWEKQ